IGWGLAAGSTKAPWAAALLFTAATLLGGWLLIYPLRKLFGGGLGHFTYFDPNAAYQVIGHEVSITDLRGWTTLTPEEIHNNGSYARTRLHFQLPGRERVVEVVRAKDADLVVDYYSNLHSLAEDENWSSKSYAELGATAKYMAIEGELPDDP